MMDFESPDVEKDFPGLYASESARKSLSRDSDYSDEEKVSQKDLLGKRKEKKESKKDKGYVPFAGVSSGEDAEEAKSPGKHKKNKSLFPKKEKKDKRKEKDSKEKKEDDKDIKNIKKEPKLSKKDSKKVKKTSEKKKDSKILKREKKKKQGEQVSEEKPIFGIPLEEAVERSKSHDGIEIPVFVRECIDYIEEHGLACEGIYRISGVKSKVRQLKCQYNRGEKVYLYEHEPHVIASLIKQFLRDLPEPILTAELTPKFEEAAALKNDQKKIEALIKLLDCLPNCNRQLLSWIFIHMLHVVQLEKRNKMNLQNVSIVLSPAMQISHRVLHALFSHVHVLFKDVEIKKYVPPIEPDSSRLSFELPDSPTAIENELSKQENLLNVLHAELTTGLRDVNKEEQLWEVQRVVTQLKRKLRFLRQVMNSNKESNEVLEVTKKEDCPSPKGDIKTYTVDQNTVSSGIGCDNESVPCASNEAGVIASICIENKSADGENDNEVKPGDTKENYSQDERHVLSSNNQMKSIENISGKEIKEAAVDSEEINAHSVVKKPSESSSNDEILALQLELMQLIIREEEYHVSNNELRRKIVSERLESERLKQEISEYRIFAKSIGIKPVYLPDSQSYCMIHVGYSSDSSENSSSDSDDSVPSDCVDESDDSLMDILKELKQKNEYLQKMNKELSQNIQKEREVCLELKVRMRVAQKDHPFYAVVTV